MKTSLLALLLSVAISQVTADNRTITDLINTQPDCTHSCLKDFYKDVVGDKCASNAINSTSTKDLNCICNVTGTKSAIQKDETELSECVAKGCGSNATEAMSVYERSMNAVVQLCSPYTNSTTSTPLPPGLASSTPSASSSSVSTASSTSSTASATASETNAATLKQASLLAGSAAVVAAFFI